MDRSRLIGVIGGFVAGVAIAVGVIFYFHLTHLGLPTLLGMAAGLGALGALLGSISGVQV